MERYCLKRNEFESNFRDSFRNMRKDERFFDVTIVTDDGQHIKAHKMMLAAGSDFFSGIFLKTDHSNMLIYLKGIRSSNFENIADFLYNGEVNIAQGDLTQFLETAQELKVKLLQGDLQGIGQNECENKKQYSSDSSNNSKCKKNEDIVGKERTLETLEELTVSFNSEDRRLEGYLQGIGNNESEKQKSDYSKINIENEVKCQTNQENVGEESTHDSLEELADSSNSVNGTLSTMDEWNLPLNTDNEIDLQVKQMIEKIDGLWECKVCGKTATHKTNIKNHVELHIENTWHACHICKKTFPSRPYLRDHISGIHSELFSCDICGKSGLNRKAYVKHKRIDHQIKTYKK